MNLISSHVYFDDKSKIHIQKEMQTMNTLCGRNLGFRFVVEGSVEDVDLDRSNICKICLKKYKLNP